MDSDILKSGNMLVCGIQGTSHNLLESHEVDHPYTLYLDAEALTYMGNLESALPNFSPVRFPKRFCRTSALVHRDRNVAGINWGEHFGNRLFSVYYFSETRAAPARPSPSPGPSLEPEKNPRAGPRPHRKLTFGPTPLEMKIATELVFLKFGPRWIHRRPNSDLCCDLDAMK